MNTTLIRQYSITTSHGEIAVEDNDVRTGTTLVLIHGNSSCRQVFQKQLNSTLAGRYRLITFDLPGHGQSSDAIDYMRTYTRPGLADATVELLDKLGVKEAAVLGWSLGGHVGLEMIHRFPGMLGLMIVGAPPIPNGNMAAGFTSAPQKSSGGKGELSPEEIDNFIKNIFEDSAEPFLYDAMARTDKRFRKRLFEAAREGLGVDQRIAVETSKVPLAIINGTEDRLIKLDYFDTVKYANCWENTIHKIPYVGHAPFWQAPDSFNVVLARFLYDITKP